jgi:hypothetical protein
MDALSPADELGNEFCFLAKNRNYNENNDLYQKLFFQADSPDAVLLIHWAERRIRAMPPAVRLREDFSAVERRALAKRSKDSLRTAPSARTTPSIRRSCGRISMKPA